MKPYFLIASLAVIASSTTFAQTTNSQTPRLDARQARQEARINQGTATGALTTKEANRLEAGQDPQVIDDPRDLDPKAIEGVNGLRARASAAHHDEGARQGFEGAQEARSEDEAAVVAASVLVNPRRLFLVHRHAKLFA